MITLPSTKTVQAMRSLPNLLLFQAVILLLAACQKEDTRLSTGQAFYENSFETTSDTKGIEAYMIVDDAPKNGGQHALYINGGCVVPHLVLPLGTVAEDLDLRLRLWGKTDEGMSGSISLMAGDQFIYVGIDTPEWQAYESDVVLHVPAGEPLYLMFSSGGFVPVGTFYDLIEIVRAD